MTNESLWQVGLAWLWEQNGGGTHPLDRRRAFLLARGMRMLGERPSTRQVNSHVNELWGPNRFAARMTKDAWRSVYRTRSTIGRTRRDDAPLFQPDRLIREGGLRPTTEQRLAAVGQRAVLRLADAAAAPDTDTYLERKREVVDAMRAFEHLRFLRLGPSELGYRGFDPERPRAALDEI